MRPFLRRDASCHTLDVSDAVILVRGIHHAMHCANFGEPRRDARTITWTRIWQG